MEALKQLNKASLETKADLIQHFYESTIFHESGMMYSMMKIADNEIRPFAPSDFIGKSTSNYDNWRFKLQGQWELLNNENSITTSGIYLASQVYRYQATKSDEALVQAGKAFHSLELIYRMGEQDGRPGWMGKPYGFRLSDQTSGDQYLDAAWGLFLYHGIASDPQKRRIEEMIINFADYWRQIDYKIVYFTSSRNYKEDRHAFNLIVLVLNILAHHFSNNPIYLREVDFFWSRARWHEENNQDAWKNKVLHKEPIGNREETIRSFNRLLEGQLRHGEYLCWESTIHSKFVAVAAELIAIVDNELIHDRLQQTLERWWSIWSLGIGEDMLPYYYFIFNALDDTWRPAPRTSLLPEGDQPLGDPFFSYCSQVRWMEPLSRFMTTSLIAALHAPGIAAEAKQLAIKLMASVDEIRIRWMYDPDGSQLIPELDYMNDVLSSEMPATYLATFWRGRHENFW
ncbi:MAG: hypothetical protein J7559_14875 [Cohnella sp.]|nr:hypothetical protein [Cohnella sp.]